MDIGHKELQLHLNSQYYCLALDKLGLISQTMRAALNKYSRVFMVRFDVHLPQLNLKYSPKIYDSAVIDRFIDYLKGTIQKGRAAKVSKLIPVKCSMHGQDTIQMQILTIIML